MDDNIAYKDTGNKIMVPIDEFTNYVEKKLAEYDKISSTSKNIPVNSPYKNQIIYVTSDNKTVRVPKYIKQQAIKLHKKIKKPKKKVVEKKDDKTQMYLYIIIGIIMMIYFYKKINA